MKILYPVFFLIFTQLFLSAEELMQSDIEVKSESKKKVVRVSVLGYHEFISSPSATQMRLPTTMLRKQLQSIKDNNLNVITLADFIAWKKGEKEIPDKSILITIDDGWKSVYTHAYPIFKEFNYPFAIYLYKNYVDGGGRALTTPMIEEMVSSGLCTIGSHSVSHPLPSIYKKQKRKGDIAYTSFLKEEFGTSKSFLEDKFKQPITTYAYPGGFHTKEMYPIAKELGYEHLFTVLPGKIKIDSDNYALPRYIILGTHDYIFTNAITFRNIVGQATDITSLPSSTPHPVSPAPATAVESRNPTISVDLSKVSELDPDSIVMRVAGYGKVPFSYDAETQKCSWKVIRPIYTESVEVSIQWKLNGEKGHEPPMKWTFLVDKTAAYQPKQEAEAVPK